jgi:hypothetical protein
VSNTSVFDVIDYLYTTISALPACAAPVAVHDGWPGVYMADDMVCIGGTPADTEQSAARGYVSLGAQKVDEEYEIPIYVRSYRGGTDQKAARDAAKTIYYAIEAALRADLTLGGNLNIHPAIVGTLNVKQTSAEDATEGRIAEVEFGVRCKNRY